MTSDKQLERLKNRDWDVIAILDACRVDAFRHIIDDEADAVEVPAYPTYEWLGEVFVKNRFMSDVTYVSGHPFTMRLPEKYGGGSLDPYVDTHVKAMTSDMAWDERLGTADPERLTEIALEQETPLVVHYLQPHTPFIGDISLGADQCLNKGETDHTHPNLNFEMADSEFDEREDSALYALADQGFIDHQLIREAYHDNLRAVWEHASQLAKEFDNVVYTADHGESLTSEEYGHSRVDTKCVKLVPWYEA